MVYGLLATDSPATRDALKVILPEPRSPARKPLSVVVRTGSAVPYVLLFATALTEAVRLLTPHKSVLTWIAYVFFCLETLSEAAGVIVYGLVATLSPATRDAL